MSHDRLSDQQSTKGFVESLRRRATGRILTTAIGEFNDPALLANRHDPGLFGPQTVTWRVHADPSMLIGGLRALLLQTLHPLAMAGVADHSRYRHDFWSRWRQTSRFIADTTFLNSQAANDAIERVKEIHEKVVGTAPDGRPYAASDPRLLLWVHCAEVDSFLTAFETYGSGKLTSAEKDRYIDEMTIIPIALGAKPSEVPTTRAELDRTLREFAAECVFDTQAQDAVEQVLRPPLPLLLRTPYNITVSAAIQLLPPWAKDHFAMTTLPVEASLVGPVMVRAATATIVRTLGWLVPPISTTEIANRFG